MHTFLTPDPITIEVRNSSGEVRLDLADVTTTTVEVTASASHPFGFRRLGRPHPRRRCG